MAIQINRIEIFTRAHRITHWLIAAGVIFQLVSAWLVQNANVDVLAWADWHVMIGQALILPILFRVYLLIIPGSGHWRLLIPTREQRHVLIQTLRFYASLGRLPCPDWYAYNPLWQPVYLLMTFVLLLTTLTGFVSGVSLAMSAYHALLASIVFYFALAHVFFVILHDARGNGAQISAMLNGYKYFHAGEVEQNNKNEVSVQSITGKKTD